ncbi:MAG TPA: aminotransferase class IV [Thermoanaerobaculia bacterium]|nr:aminotransferase class IV [Thermoanaerobaculia bacterium]
MSDLCSLDGTILPLAEARISPLDRGFLFGDGVYEMMKILGGEAVLWPAHRQRLADGLAVARLTPSGGVEALERACAELLASSGVGEGSLYLEVTRGAGRREKIPLPDLPATVFAWASAHPHPAPAGLPQVLVSQQDIRWGRCDVKAVSLMATVLGKLAAGDAGADEVLFVGPGGEVREGGSTSFFVLRDGVLVTHPLGHRILPGVTRKALLAVAGELGLAVDETPPRLAERTTWDEAMIASTLLGVQPVTALDGAPIGQREPGPWTRRLASAVADHERRHTSAFV